MKQVAFRKGKGKKGGKKPIATTTTTQEASPQQGQEVYQFKVTIKDSYPKVWRRIQVHAALTLQKLRHQRATLARAETGSRSASEWGNWGWGWVE